MAKSSRSEIRWELVIREGRFWNFDGISSGALRALCYWGEHSRTWKVWESAPFGVKGSNPLQVLWLQGRLAYSIVWWWCTFTERHTTDNRM